MSIENKIPIYVSGDGNCLFNAISVSLVGSEKLATQIRVLTCIEMVMNKSLYDNEKYERLILVSPSYDTACKDAAIKGAYSAAWSMLAASTVVGCPIQSVYPPRNGILDTSVGVLNTKFQPVLLKSKDAIVIMWTSSSYGFSKTWLPNHFVPLINMGNDISSINIDCMEEFPALNSSPRSRLVCPTIFDTTLNSQSAYEESYHKIDNEMVDSYNDRNHKYVFENKNVVDSPVSESPNVVNYTISENQKVDFSVSENKNADDSMMSYQSKSKCRGHWYKIKREIHDNRETNSYVTKEKS